MVGSDMDFIALLNVTAAAGSVIQQATAAFRQHPHLFTDIKSFPGTIEFIEFRHIPSGFHVDLIFNDFEGMRSTELVHYIIHLDARLYDLVLIIRYWARVHRLTRVRVLSNYAMTLLVVFYLQQKDILPSIASLQRDAEPFFLKDWNTGFDKTEYQPRINATLYQLLGGFFEFYNEFNFNKYIISAFTGCPIERNLFKDLRTVPEEYYLYKYNVEEGISRALILGHTPMIIQDPFTHFENLGKHMSSRQVAKFKSRCRSAVLSYRRRRSKQNVFLGEILSNA